MFDDRRSCLLTARLLAALAIPAALFAQDSARVPDPIVQLVGRLELERYKATIKGLTAFGDRRQGTDRNRAAVDWIEAQLRSYGCSDVSRLKYDFQPSPPSPEEMYIVGAHMDGIGWGEAANDDGSGTALVMELARVLNAPDVRTDRSIRFALWNNEETGLNGARAYVEQRRALQGTKQEPKWLGMIQHDMMLFDHGMPRADGTLAATQRPEADVNIEFQTSSKFAAQAQQLAWVFHVANEKYATDYPASVGSHMTNTDSAPFQDLVPAISLRENERGTQIGAGWDPNWHQPTDLYATYDDADFRLGLNAAQTPHAAPAGPTGATPM